MAKKRTLTCDCGSTLKERITPFEGFETEAMVCPTCKFVTLTMQQAGRYLRLRKLHNLIDAERKVIRIGNSMGITLPDKLSEFGVKVGTKVKTTAVGPNSFLVKLK